MSMKPTMKVNKKVSKLSYFKQQYIDLDVITNTMGPAHLEVDTVVNNGKVGMQQTCAHHCKPARVIVILQENK